LAGYEFEKIFPGCRLIDIHEYLLEKEIKLEGVQGTRYMYHDPCHSPMKLQDPLKTVNALITTADAVKIEKNDRCCGESGTFAISRPDVSTQVRFRKEQEMRKGADALRADGFKGDVKILTSYPSCLQGLSRYNDDSGTDANYIVAEMAKHPNLRYFVLKSIMLNNLYGVDIMEEATEICKLRLFLKLVAQMEPQPKKQNFGLEPLPDIDFNIRAGNTLVGFASLNEVCEAMARDTQTGQGRLIFDDGVLNRIVQGAVAADMEFKRFKSLQVQDSIAGADVAESKRLLKAALAQLREELDRYLAEEYELGLSKKSGAFQKWKESHQPFHWFVEFYSIINRGGFDVIIGNPPYVEYSKIRKEYKIIGYTTESSGNLYAQTLERSVSLINTGRVGMIVPISFSCTKRMQLAQRGVIDKANANWISHFGERPSKLFDGAEVLLNIIIL
jgi:hypothetical protein